ncbi:cytochrome P450 [Allokutzneria sp. A3M-2-11 16]|uniref:cytochrome P450 n=1 Tax=Allokutzneria sp. A3M-2-11 16 TaxID=2962043 RepID=UPI0020B8B4D9|nr:cytochrome P450 [Allokutzneria sp. A3M-2-11 16]MCP3805014.1 cytochrome P450 [Allokutzneria sp. A3M-2-11 16]
MRTPEIDVLSSHVYATGVPYAQLAHLRCYAPVFRQEIPDPQLLDEAWVITRAADVRTISMRPEIFSSSSGVALRRYRTAEGKRLDVGNFINLDDPEHRLLRNLVGKGFTPRIIRRFEQDYRGLAETIVADALRQNTFDFVTEISAELPLLAICKLLGVPEADREKFFRWSNVLLGAEDPEYTLSPTELADIVVEFREYVLELVQARRAHPREDILSVLATATPGEALTDDEIAGFALLLMLAGNETTRNNISHGLIALMENPEQWHALRGDPRLLDSAVEEIIRWAAPVNYMVRTVMRDTELHGVKLREGERVAMMYASANRDEDLYTDGDAFDITRPDQRHLSFGIGPHFCLGAHLARIETKVVFAELLKRVDRFHLAGPIRRLESSFIHGIKHLPVTAQRF